jgi:hypothetical protein
MMQRTKSSVEKLSGLATALTTIDLGYPLGDNRVRPAPSVMTRASILERIRELSPSLTDFYVWCDGLSFPDVHNGYFISSADQLLDNSSSLVRIEGEPHDSGIPVVAIGSGGGGQRFVVRSDNGEVLILSGGLLENGIFHSDGSNVVEVAPDWNTFLERLICDVEAFINDDHDHIYLI